jgi:sugar lactone lactonase YvrE
MRRFGKLLLALLVVVIAYLLLWPVPIQPVAWTPPQAPALAGDYAPNEKLANLQRWPLDDAHGPEAVAVDADGRVYTGVEDGRILRFSADGRQREIFANLGTRPLGMQFDKDGNLIVCANSKGLLSVGRDGAAQTLTDSVNGQKFKSTNELDIAADGAVYFTETSTRWPIEQFRNALFEHLPDGRLLAYEPQTRQTRVVLDGLYFANGVAVSPDQSFVLVAETGAYRIRRVWLAGDKKGRNEIFADNLPGFPDNLSATADGRFWVAYPTPRNSQLDMVLPYPFARKMIFRLPAFLQPKPARYGFVAAYDTAGRVVENLQDPQGRFEQITGVWERAGKLYLSSLSEDAVAVWSR